MLIRTSPPKDWTVPCNREKGFQSVPTEDGICQPRPIKSFDQTVNFNDFSVDKMLEFGMNPHQAGEVSNLFILPKTGNYADDFDVLFDSFDATSLPPSSPEPPSTSSNPEQSKTE